MRHKFLIRVGRAHLEPEEKQALKRLVEQELQKMQADTGTREGKPDLTKVKRSPAPCSDPERKRFRFNSESESSSAPSSPDCSGPPTKNKTSKKVCPRRALKKAVESTDEDQQTDLGAKMGSEASSEEAEGSVRSGEVWKAENTEEDEAVRKEQKGRARKKAGAKNEQAPCKANREQVREERGNGEEEAVLGRGEVEGTTDAKCQEESGESGEEILAEKEEQSEPRPRSGKAGRRARERKSYRQRSRVGGPPGGLGDSEAEKERGAVSGGDSSGEEEEHSARRKSQGRTQPESGRRQSACNEDARNSTQVQAAAQGTTKPGSRGSSNGDSSTEREVSDSQAGQNTKEERKSRSSKKSFKNGKTRSSSSSSDASPEPTGQKAGSCRRGEDHPAVVRLKRYIRACGAHRNYKKLLGSCSSHKERLSVLRAELEALGMKGNPSLEKCRALKQQREEAAEVASLDVANIISSTGRPRRRTAWNPSGEGISPGELYHRTLDSDEERPRQAPPDWSHMRGVISSDGDSS